MWSHRSADIDYLHALSIIGDMVHPDLNAEIAKAKQSLHFPDGTIIDPAQVEGILNHSDFQTRFEALGHVVEMTAIGNFRDDREVDDGQLTASSADAERLGEQILKDTRANQEALWVAHRVARNRLPQEQKAPWII